MKTIFILDQGKLVVDNLLINDIDHLVQKVIIQAMKQNSEDDLHCFVYDLFDKSELDTDDINASLYNEDVICKLGVFIFNLRRIYFNDHEQAAIDFNKEDCPLKLGFEDGVFFPLEIGHWYSQNEFIFLSNDEKDKDISLINT